MSDASDPNAAEAVLWGSLTWPQIEQLAQQPPHMAILPVGTIEQHGRHLPVDVDIVNCWRVAVAVSERTGVPVLPGLPYGDSGYWRGWPGTVSLSHGTLLRIIEEIAEGVAASGFTRLLILNGHVGNGPAIKLSEMDVRDGATGLQVRALNWWEVSARVAERTYADAFDGHLKSFHANDSETSVYLSHSPHLVSMENAVDEPDNPTRTVFSYHSKKLTRSGVIGTPSKATAERGAELFEMAVEDIAALVLAGFDEDVPPDAWGVAKP